MTLTLGNELDANTNKIIRLADGTDPKDAINLSQLTGLSVGDTFTPAQNPPTNAVSWATEIVSATLSVTANNTLVDLSGTLPATASAVFIKGVIGFSGGGQPTSGDGEFIISPVSGSGTIHAVSKIGGTDGNWKTGAYFDATLSIDPSTRSFYWSWRDNGFNNSPQWSLKIYLIGWLS
jgi:hypothetical protein